MYMQKEESMNNTQNARGVFERPKGSGIYWINYYDGAGRRHREKVGPLAAAVDLHQRRTEDIAQQRLITPRFARPRTAAPVDSEERQRVSRLSFGRVMQDYLHAKKHRVSHFTWDADRRRAGVLEQIVGRSTHIQDINAGTIESTLTRVATRGVSSSTMKQYRALLSSMFKFAVRHGLRAVNPVAGLPGYKPNDGRIRELSPEEEHALRAEIRKTCPKREPELDLAMHTGFRRGEQFGLRWGDVDRGRGFATVYGKTGRRTVPLNSAARAALAKLHEFSEGGQWVVRELRHRAPGRRQEASGGRLRDTRRWFEEAIRAASIENFRWHDLRHTWATRLLRAGVDLVTLQKLGGWKDISMVLRYAHTNDQQMRRAVALLARDEETQPGRAAQSGAGRVIVFRPPTAPPAAS